MDIFSGTEIFLVNCNVVGQQHVAGAKAPILRLIDTGGNLTGGKLNMTSSTTHKAFTELQIKKLVLNSVRDVYIELLSPTRLYRRFVGTGKVVLALMFRNFRGVG